MFRLRKVISIVLYLAEWIRMQKSFLNSSSYLDFFKTKVELNLLGL